MLVSTLSTFFELFDYKVCFWARQPTAPPQVGQGLLIHEVSRSHTTTHHTRYDSSGRVISSSQRPLPDNTQHSQQTYLCQPVGFEPTISTGERMQTYALDRAATGTGDCRSVLQIHVLKHWVNNFFCSICLLRF